MDLGSILTGMPLNLIMSLGQILDYNNQYGEQRQLNRDQLGQALGSLGYLGGNEGTGVGSIDGQEFKLPDVMGSINKFGSDLFNRIGGDTQYAQGQLRGLGADLASLYGGQTDRMLGDYDTGANRVAQYANDRASNVYNGYLSNAAGYKGDINRMVDTLNNTAQGRLDRGMSLLQGMGDQTRRDINSQYNANAGRIGQDLMSRGLGNSTVRSSMLQGNERERGNTLGRLDESLRNQALGTYTGLSGDVLGTQQYGTGLRSDAFGNIMNNAANLQSGLTGDVLNTNSQLFGNRMNLQGGLVGQGIGAQAGNMADIVNAGISGRQNQTGQLGSTYGQQINQMNSAGQNMVNTILGTNYTYPESPWASIQQTFQGLGAQEATRDAMNRMDKAREQSWWNPMNYLGGGLNVGSGGVGYNARVGF